MTTAAALALLMWCCLLLLPWQPWRTRERLVGRRGAAVAPASARAATTQVTAIVPARNEAAHIAATVRALRAQADALRILVIDDQSTDGTAALAREAAPGVTVIRGAPLPPGWTGKLWALEQGIAAATTPRLLLVDADVQLAPGVLDALLERQAQADYALVSVMATLSMRFAWERLLIPAFIYFFKLLYPFALANGAGRRFHAAAGGCMLLRRDALEQVGGVAALRDAVIDDCTLAGKLKRAGYRTWVGLSRDVVSSRRYRRLGDTWAMVARTAFIQLRCSTLALLACTALLLLAFVVPVIALLMMPTSTAGLLGTLALLAMATSYLPVIRYYGLPAPMALTLPVAGTLYLAMTWTSAINAWRGLRARWKDREYTNVV